MYIQKSITLEYTDFKLYVLNIQWQVVVGFNFHILFN